MSGAGATGSSSGTWSGSTAWCLNPALQKQFWIIVELVSFYALATMFVAATISNCLRSAFASLLFSTLMRYLSANFLYLLFTDRIICWSSGCTTEVVFGGNMKNLMWEYSRTWGLDALSQTHSTCQPAALI